MRVETLLPLGKIDLDLRAPDVPLDETRVFDDAREVGRLGCLRRPCVTAGAPANRLNRKGPIGMTDADRLARACADMMWGDDRASRGLGMTLDHVATGKARLSMMVRPEMVNGHGLCHGGFIFALADSAMAFASNGHGERAVAYHNDITYLRPGRLGETLVAAAEERVRSGRSGIYDVRVTGEDGTIVAEFRGHTRSIGQRFDPPETAR